MEFWRAVFEHLIPQTDRTPDRRIPIVAMLDERLYQNRRRRLSLRRHAAGSCAFTRSAIRPSITRPSIVTGADFLDLPHHQQDVVLSRQSMTRKAEGRARASGSRCPSQRFWQMIMTDAIEAYYAHPWAWDEIGFGGPAYPRAYTRLERGEPEPWEVEEQRYDWLAPRYAVSESRGDASSAIDRPEHSSLKRRTIERATPRCV